MTLLAKNHTIIISK